MNLGIGTTAHTDLEQDQVRWITTAIGDCHVGPDLRRLKTGRHHESKPNLPGRVGRVYYETFLQER